MAEINIQRKRKNLWWLWLLILLIILAVVYYLYNNNYFDRENLNVTGYIFQHSMFQIKLQNCPIL